MNRSTTSRRVPAVMLFWSSLTGVPEVEKLLDIIKKRLAAGEGVMISGFGKWMVKSKHARRGRNPQTGEELVLDARKVFAWNYSPHFKKGGMVPARAEEMKKKDYLERELKENTINLGLCKNRWSLVQSVQSIRDDYGDKVAIFELVTTIQCLVSPSLESRTHRLLKALLPHQKNLLETINLEEPDLAKDALDNGTPLFRIMDFLSAERL